MNVNAMHKVGNGRCNPECSHERTGQDGGDCDLARNPCDESKLGDGRCDAECNRAYHGWDGGDCCDSHPDNTTANCFDPASPNRFSAGSLVTSTFILVL